MTELSMLNGADNVYVAPNIPNDKLFNAISSYAMDVKKDRILILLDDTLMGSAKDGMLVSKDAVYIKEAFERYKKFEIKDIYIIYAKKGMLSTTIYINNNKICTFTQANFQSIHTICEIINKISKQEKEPDDKQSFSLFKNIAGDNLYSILRVGRASKNVNIKFNTDISNDVEVDFDDRKINQGAKDEVKKFICRNVVNMRKTHIQNNNLPQLENDLATLELLIYSTTILFLELRMQGVPQKSIRHLLFESLCNLLGENNQDIAMYVVNRSTYIGLMDAINGLYLHLFLSNRKGDLILGTYDSVESVCDDNELMDYLLNDIDANELDEHEFNTFITLRISYMVRELIGEINASTKEAKECALNILKD